MIGGRGGFNPYRHGVLIGNFVEDIFGTDLREKYRSQSQQRQNPPISEVKDKYRWPYPKKEDMFLTQNNFTSNVGMGFDLNIDFNKKNVDDFLKLNKTDEGANKNKTANLSTIPNQQNAEHSDETKDLRWTEEKKHRDPFSQNYQFDLFSKKRGLKGNLLFGHGLEPKNFNDNDYGSTYHLTMDKKERTEVFYNPKYSLRSPFMHPSKTVYDNKDWGFRRFKIYEDFTKRIDHQTCLEK